MYKVLRPRRFFNYASRKFSPNTTLLGNSIKSESKILLDGRIMGFEKMLLNKLSFFYLAGNVFTFYCIMKAGGWALTIFERAQNKKFEDEILAQAEKEYKIPKPKTCKLLFLIIL